MADARMPREAERLLRYLASPEVAPVLRETGLEP
jgi:molybdate transport system substrate-binding protein